MNVILAATDFSDASANSVAYAAAFAKHMKAKLVLFHVYHIPVITSEAPIVIPPLEEIEKSCLLDLENAAKKIRLETGEDLNVECVCKCGFVADEIAQTVSEKKADLVVMGMQGAGYIGETLIGSITTEFIKDGVCPVLTIGENVRFSPFKNIILACDYKEKFISGMFKPLKEIALAFGSKVVVLNVARQAVAADESQRETEEERIDLSLGAVDHSFHHIQNEDAVEGITAFAEKEKADLVVMLPHRLSFFANLFHKRSTKAMAFHSRIPLLTLPEPMT